jgi:hypothetical protein
MNMNLVRAVHLKKEVLTFTGFMFEIMIMMMPVIQEVMMPVTVTFKSKMIYVKIEYAIL